MNDKPHIKLMRLKSGRAAWACNSGPWIPTGDGGWLVDGVGSTPRKAYTDYQRAIGQPRQWEMNAKVD